VNLFGGYRNSTESGIVDAAPLGTSQSVAIVIGHVLAVWLDIVSRCGLRESASSRARVGTNAMLCRLHGDQPADHRRAHGESDSNERDADARSEPSVIFAMMLRWISFERAVDRGLAEIAVARREAGDDSSKSPEPSSGCTAARAGRRPAS